MERQIPPLSVKQNIDFPASQAWALGKVVPCSFILCKGKTRRFVLLVSPGTREGEGEITGGVRVAINTSREQLSICVLHKHKTRLGKLLMRVLPGASELRTLLGAEMYIGDGEEAAGFLRWVEGK